MHTCYALLPWSDAIPYRVYLLLLPAALLVRHSVKQQGQDLSEQEMPPVLHPEWQMLSAAKEKVPVPPRKPRQGFSFPWGGNTVTVVCIEEFDVAKPSSWDSYNDQFILLEIGEIIEANQKCVVSSAVISSQVCNTVSSLISPAKPCGKSYDKMLTLLKNHFALTQSETLVPFQPKLVHLPKEQVTAYIADLSCLTENSTFDYQSSLSVEWLTLVWGSRWHSIRQIPHIAKLDICHCSRRSTCSPCSSTYWESRVICENEIEIYQVQSQRTSPKNSPPARRKINCSSLGNCYSCSGSHRCDPC